MKRIIQLILATLVAAAVSGCAATGSYWSDRSRDAADIFTVTGGLGGGAKARVGPVGAGVLFQTCEVGLRGGSISTHRCPNLDVIFICTGMEAFDNRASRLRCKDFGAEAPVFLYFPRKQLIKRTYNTKWPYYTQLDVVAALGPSVRLGFNPGELLDFLLGFAKVDIADDDTAAQLQEKARPRPKTYRECTPQPSDELKKFEEKARKEHPEWIHRPE